MSMERLLSMESSRLAPSTTSDPAHKRNASIKSGGKSISPSIGSLFVTNLRLLNLDLLSDWPNITPSSFSNQDARARIRAAEYALYQLFKIYDPITTADKLQPFFPPLEPLQSVNLRAALFRCLSELKKSGVLSKDTVLRKSMLDDCQGDKFWEVCLNFSAIALRKASLEKKVKHGRPIAERIGTAKISSNSQRESMLPLAIAHKAALSKVLHEKRRKRETYVRLYDLLSDKDTELKQRKFKSQDQGKKMKSLQSEKLRAVEQAVEKSWIGSMELKDALINGDTCAKGDGLLLESFDQLWQQDSDKASIVSNGAEVGLLQDLASKATQQSVRLSMWQTYLDRLVASKPTNSQKSRPHSGASKPAPHFDKHRALNLKDRPSGEDDKIQQNGAKQRCVSRYDEILTAMREELRKNSAPRAHTTAPKPPVQPLKRSQTQPTPARNRSLDLDASPGAKDPHSRSPSQTAVPVGPRLGRRMSSQPKLYEKPKVDGQREPIPLKSEIFSPLKENRRSNTSLNLSAPMLPSPAEERELPDFSNDSAGNSAAPATPGSASKESFDYDATRKSRDGNPDSARSPTDGTGQDSTTTGAAFKIPTIPEKKHHTAKNAARPSLVERTRMSIAFNSSEDVSGFLPDTSAADSADPGSTEGNSPATTTPTLFDRRASLLERTRESISVAPAAQQAPKLKKPIHNRARSSLYPVNQFETPQKARSSTITSRDDIRRDTTPIEQLLSPDAEYDSVFKSRPKIALSPVLSPYRDAELDGNEQLETDVGASPLAGVSLRDYD